jgi:hypothetical protein
MDPTLIVFQFYQNEIGRFRATFELTPDDYDELTSGVPPAALGRRGVIPPAAVSEASQIRRSCDTI